MNDRIPEASVSVVVSTFNAKHDLLECLMSLEAQTHKSMEVVVVDDGSTDGTKEALAAFADQTALNLVVVNNEANLGVAGARNVGIGRAEGEIVAFLDADAVAERDWITEMLRGFRNDGVAGVGGLTVEKDIGNIWELLEKGSDRIGDREGYVAYVRGCNMAFRSGILRAHPFDDEIKYGFEETLLCDLLAEEGHKLYHRPQALVRHKRRNSAAGLLMQKYERGKSAVWYRKKRAKPLLYRRHVALSAALAACAFGTVSWIAQLLAGLLVCVFVASLARDEIQLRRKTAKELAITLPLIVMMELGHYTGSLVGLMKHGWRRGGNGRRVHS
jgi:GT2 family glycosyltransferase